MPIKNSKLQYGSVAKWLHWLTALCFLVAYVSVYTGIWTLEYRSPERRLATTLHIMFGMSVLVLVIPRLVWKLINIQPKLDPGPRWQHMASHWAHWALYFFIITMPLSGWMGYGGRTMNMFWLFELPSFRGTELFQWLVVERMGMEFETWEAPIDYFHKVIAGGWIVWILIMIHIAAALYHHFVQRDNTLKKMLPGVPIEDKL